jgi:hypothetical protein
LLVAATSAKAGVLNYSGNDWVAECCSKDRPAQASCHAYTLGIAQGLAIMRSRCIPAEVNAAQMVDVGLK